jgi:repressor LexA
MKTSLGERMMKIIEFYGLNKNSFSVKIGLPNNSLIVKIVNEPDRGCGIDLLQKIAEVFDDIDMNWLVSEKGSMLKKPKSPDTDYNFIKYYHGNSNAPSDHLRVFGYEDCDSAFDVVGDSMYPKFRTADIVICKEVPLNSIIPYGEAFFLVIKGSPLIRYIKSNGDNGMIRVGAENQRYEDGLISLADVDKAYLIKGAIRREVF